MKKAFTLAEVLVTLGIIGVVAAMTVPNLMENYQRQSYVTQLRKLHSELSQALETAMNEANTQSLYEVPAIRDGSFLTRYFKTTKTCTADDLSGCFADQYTSLNGDAIRLRDYISDGASCGVVASGYSICIVNRFYAVVDINGKQAPNVYGRDMFTLYFPEDGLVTSNIEPENASIDNCRDAEYGECFAKILNDGWVMDY